MKVQNHREARLVFHSMKACGFATTASFFTSYYLTSHLKLQKQIIVLFSISDTVKS